MAELDNWISKVRQGDPRALARALSEVENGGRHRDQLLETLFPHSGKAWRVGVTGAPGAGKSSLVNRLTAHLRQENLRVAIVTVDPTSPFTGGSLLGDRIRMLSHQGDAGVFVRSMAARGSLGGLAPATADAITILEAAGYDVILIETVGVGQAEIDVVKLSAVVAVILTPSMGDDVQTIKAGIMEIADAFVINKADLPGADRVESELEAMLSLTSSSDRPQPPILRTVATEDVGTKVLLESLRGVKRQPEYSVAYWEQRLADMIRQRLLEDLMARELTGETLQEAARAIAERRLNPYQFVEGIIAASRKS